MGFQGEISDYGATLRFQLTAEVKSVTSFTHTHARTHARTHTHTVLPVPPFLDPALFPLSDAASPVGCR